MKKHFKSTITIDSVDHVFHFERTDDNKDDPHTVTVKEDESSTTFIMTKDAEGQWNITTAGIPDRIRHAELFIREAILDHEGDDNPASPPNPWNILGE